MSNINNFWAMEVQEKLFLGFTDHYIRHQKSKPLLCLWGINQKLNSKVYTCNIFLDKIKQKCHCAWILLGELWGRPQQLEAAGGFASSKEATSDVESNYGRNFSFQSRKYYALFPSLSVMLWFKYIKPMINLAFKISNW